MHSLLSHQIWQNRLKDINDPIRDIRIPEEVNQKHDQDEEWCEVVTKTKTFRVRFHDYEKVFEIPGLYEKLFYDTLECCSPSYVVNLLDNVCKEWNAKLSDFKVLDVGAGNGMVGDELFHKGVDQIVGVDILQEAKVATYRDRPDVYEEYCVTDLTRLPSTDEEKLGKFDFNCMTTVAALGYGDIPPEAFLKAMELTTTPSWLAFNIKEDFLLDNDPSGFSHLIRKLIEQRYIQPQCYRRYRHRLSIDGDPLYYIAMIATKLKPVHAKQVNEFCK